MIEAEKKPIFIFEGPDNSGKDTLIGMLKKHIWDVSGKTVLEIHPKYEKSIGGEYKEYFERECTESIDMLNSIDRIVIFNRFVHSEYIYGQKYRNYIPDYISEIEMKLLNLNRPIILIYTYARAVILRTREDGLSFSKGNIENIYQELDYYDAIMKKSLLNVLNVDTSSCEPEGDFEKIQNTIKKNNIIL